MRPEDLLERVCDRKTFLEFAWALQAEAAEAPQIIWNEPEKHRYDDPSGWTHLDVGNFLGEVLSRFETHRGEPTWKNLAEWLWCGKIIE